MAHRYIITHSIAAFFRATAGGTGVPHTHLFGDLFVHRVTVHCESPEKGGGGGGGGGGNCAVTWLESERVSFWGD